MSARSAGRAMGVAATAAVVVLAMTTPAAAEPEPQGPELAAADVSVTENTDGTADVAADFRLTAPTEGGTEVALLLMPRDDVQVTELSSPAAGMELGPLESGRVSATLHEDTREFTLDYTVERADDEAAVLLAVPEIATARDAEVAITVTLPEGEEPVGDSMPSFERSSAADGPVTLEHHGGELPSVVVAGYGERPGPRIGTALSIAALAALGLVFALRFTVGRRAESEGAQ